jgi:hypothetical protein
MDDAEILRRSIEETRDATDPLMALCLSFAVPLWIDMVRSWTPEARQAKAQAAGHMIAYGAGAADVATGGKERGKGRRKGAAAEVFNAVACGLAILAYQPGGVTWGGSHWEARDTAKHKENDFLPEWVDVKDD